MLDGPAVRLAVARLTEIGQAAARFRQDPDRPLEGYCLVTGDERHCRVTIFVENGRTLSDRRPGGAFYYEGWIVGSSGPVSVGAFNTGATGGGSGTCTRAADELGLTSPAVVRVTVEPFGGSPAGAVPVLEGPLIWLHGEPAAAPSPSTAGDRTDPVLAAVPAGTAAGQEQPAAESPPSVQDAAPEAAPAAVTSHVSQEPPALEAPPDAASAPAPALARQAESPPVAAAEVAPEAPAPTPETPTAAGSLPADPAMPVTETPAGPSALVSGTPAEDAATATAAAPAQPAPAAPAESNRSGGPAPMGDAAVPPEQPSAAQAPPAYQPPGIAPATLTITLHSRHPMAPRAAGTAVLHLREGRVVVTVRGLPSPAALGRVPGLDRPFNGYRLWLLNQRSGMRQPLGPLTRVWGENFRAEEGPGLPLARYDTLLVTADDRKAPSPDPHWPHVLVATIESAGN